jgi:hypothetical protein
MIAALAIQAIESLIRHCTVKRKRRQGKNGKTRELGTSDDGTSRTWRLHTPMETFDYDLKMSTRTCVVALLKVVAQAWLSDENPEIDLQLMQR